MDKYKAVMKDMNYSLKQVERAKPIIKSLLNGGEIKAVEGNDNEICLMLDRTCGTDYFQCYGQSDGKLDGLVWGVGSRFQSIRNGYKPFNTFSIRKSRESGANTEFAKRKFAIDNGGIYPYLTMQGYYDEVTGEILSLAIAKTKDIWDYIESGNCQIRHTGANQIGQADFYVIPWDKYEQSGNKIKIYERRSVDNEQGERKSVESNRGKDKRISEIVSQGHT